MLRAGPVSTNIRAGRLKNGNLDREHLLRFAVGPLHFLPLHGRKLFSEHNGKTYNGSKKIPLAQCGILTFDSTISFCKLFVNQGPHSSIQVKQFVGVPKKDLAQIFAIYFLTSGCLYFQKRSQLGGLNSRLVTLIKIKNSNLLVINSLQKVF